jgi:hypothetical protein
VKIFIDDSGGFGWTPHGVSLFCALITSDRTIDGITSSFAEWKRRQPLITVDAEVKGTRLSQLQQASFVNSVVLKNAGLRLTLAGTKTTLFYRQIAERFIKDSADVLRAAAKSFDETDRTPLGCFFRRMAKWMSGRSPENLMWIHCLGDAILLSIQYSIVLFAAEADDCEFENIDIYVDQSFIARPAHIEFWREWLRDFLYSSSTKRPTMIIKEWSQRDHPFNRKYPTARNLRDLSDLFRNHIHFVNSEDSLGVQIADICANICYKFYSGKPRYRPYRLLRSRITGKRGPEIHYGILNESSLLIDSPENHVRDYSEEELAAMAEMEAIRGRSHEQFDD